MDKRGTCPSCGAPTAMVFGNPRKDGLCAKCARERKQRNEALKTGTATEEASSGARTVSRRTSVPRSAPVTVPEDNSVAYGFKRWLLHFFLSLLFWAACVALVGVVDRLIATWSGYPLTIWLPLPLIGMGILGLAVGAVSASFYTLSGMNGFVKKANEHKVKKVRLTPLDRFIWLDVVIAVLCGVAFALSLGPVRSGEWSLIVLDGRYNVSAMIPAALLGGAIYALVTSVFSIIFTVSSECTKCFHFDCKIETSRSDEAVAVETETRNEDRYNAGQRVDFSDGSYATTSGSWSTTTKTRAVTTKTWTQHAKCKWCGAEYTSGEKEVSYGKWSD